MSTRGHPHFQLLNIGCYSGCGCACGGWDGSGRFVGVTGGFTSGIMGVVALLCCGASVKSCTCFDPADSHLELLYYWLYHLHGQDKFYCTLFPQKLKIYMVHHCHIWGTFHHVIQCTHLFVNWGSPLRWPAITCMVTPCHEYPFLHSGLILLKWILQRTAFGHAKTCVAFWHGQQIVHH